MEFTSNHFGEKIPIVTLIFIAFNVLLSEGYPEERYLGCFSTDNSLQRDATTQTNEQLSIEWCLEHCRRNTSLTYARLQSGNVCHCTNDQGIQTKDTECMFPCSGNKSQYCGGDRTGTDHLSKFSLYSVCPVGKYGQNCDQGCHCKQEIPCDRISGCLERCNCPTEPLSGKYIGCFKDDNDERAIAKAWTISGVTTISTCLDACKNKSSSYAGLQFGGECFCGETYDKHGRLDESRCNMTCGYRSSEYCGGSNANSVYRVCRLDKHGKGCQLRDCSQKNGDCKVGEICLSVDLNYAKVNACRCAERFRKTQISKECSDIDECSETPSICGKNALSCNNTIGSYICTCENGKIINSTSCSGHESKLAGIPVVAFVMIVLFPVVIIIAFLVIYMCRRKNSTNKPLEEEPNLEFEASPYECSPYASYSRSQKDVNLQELPETIRWKLSTSGLLDKEFKRVPMETKENTSYGKNQDLKKKNRFKNIIPYDCNRVVLRKVRDIPFTDYIDASFVKGYNSTDKFIATQGPTIDTLYDFWRMVLEKDVHVIVMITCVVENRKVKCEKYWPDSGKSVTFGDISVSTTAEKTWKDYVSRKLLVTHSDNSTTREVVHWHFLSWPDHGVPNDTNKFLQFHRKARQNMITDTCTVVHCSAGAGRTGCFIAIDYLLEQGKSEGKVDILGCLQLLRQQRSQMIQTLEQYRFVHSALLLQHSVGNTTIPNAMLDSHLKTLTQVDSDKRLCKLDMQFQCLMENKKQMAGKEYSQIAPKYFTKNKAAEIDAAFVKDIWGKDAYLTMAFPTQSTMEEFYTLSREFNCKLVIFFDEEQVSENFLFPTENKQILLRSYKLECECSLKEDFGYCYKISEGKQSNDTYANFASVAIYANAGNIPETREIQVIHVTESVERKSSRFQTLASLHGYITKLNTRRDDSPIIVISRTGYASIGFSLAALMAFDMSRQEKEVDIYQIVQDIRKSREQFEFSLVAYKELHEIACQYVGVTG